MGMITYEKAFEIVILRVNLRILITRYLMNKLKEKRDGEGGISIHV